MPIEFVPARHGQGRRRQARLVDDNVEGVVIANRGHWLMEEATAEVLPRLVQFLK